MVEVKGQENMCTGKNQNLIFFPSEGL